VKTQVKNTVLYTIAFLLFFFGNAVNVIHFCCDVCRVQGARVFTESICHEQKLPGKLAGFDLSDSERHDGATCSLDQNGGFPFHLTHQHEACSLDRESITLDGFYKKINVSPLTLMSLIFSGHWMNGLTDIKTATLSFPLHASAIPLTGRQLLNKICVLRN